MTTRKLLIEWAKDTLIFAIILGWGVLLGGLAISWAAPWAFVLIAVLALASAAALAYTIQDDLRDLINYEWSRRFG